MTKRSGSFEEQLSERKHRLKLSSSFMDDLDDGLDDDLNDNVDDNLDDGGNEPYVDWIEICQAHVFKVDLPGLKKEEVKVEIDEQTRVMQISGKWRMRMTAADSVQANKTGCTWHKAERINDGIFSRKFELPNNAKLEDANAAMADGLLTVTIPTKAMKKICIQIRSSPS